MDVNKKTIEQFKLLMLQGYTFQLGAGKDKVVYDSARVLDEIKFANADPLRAVMTELHAGDLLNLGQVFQSAAIAVIERLATDFEIDARDYDPGELRVTKPGEQLAFLASLAA